MERYADFGSMFSQFDQNSLDYLMKFGLTFVGIVLAVFLLCLMLTIVLYVFRSIGLYTIAKRRGIHNPWLAWIPVAQNWILGCISDQYQYVVKGKICNKRKIMLGLAIGQIMVNLATSVLGSGAIRAARYGMGASDLLPAAVLGINLLNVCVSLTMFVFVCIGLYDLYTSCNPQDNVAFLVLGILFPIIVPFFVFFSRKKDYGMPPRVQQPPVYQQQIWNNE